MYPAKTVGPRISISPTSPGGATPASVTIRTSVSGSGKPDEDGLRGASSGSNVVTCDVASVRPYVGATGNATANALLDEPRRRRASAKEDAAQGRWPGRVAACIEHALEHGRDDRHERHAIVDGGQRAFRFKTLVENHGNGADDAAEEDGQPADVEERHRRQPDVLRVMTEVEGGGDCAEPEVAIGDASALRPPAGPRGVDDRRFPLEIDPG